VGVITSGAILYTTAIYYFIEIADNFNDIHIPDMANFVILFMISFIFGIILPCLVFLKSTWLASRGSSRADAQKIILRTSALYDSLPPQDANMSLYEGIVRNAISNSGTSTRSTPTPSIVIDVDGKLEYISCYRT
jgi:hypothetical protein